MIKFFRNIRRRLLRENRFTRYLIYAIGEIILVVIGILIALQINNWNEKQKLKHQEEIILKEFISAIDIDLLDQDDYYWRLGKMKEGIDSLMYFIEIKEPKDDTVFMYSYAKLGYQPILRFDSGPYNSLISNGVDKITNDSLRSSIVRIYSIHLPALQEFFRFTYDENIPVINELERNIFRITPYKFPGEKDSRLIRMPNIKNILQNDDFLWILALREQLYANTLLRLESMRKALKKLKKRIEKELNHD